MQLDHSYWGRPEDLDAADVPRPAYVINATLPGSDMAGSVAAALASASLVTAPMHALHLLQPLVCTSMVH